MFGQANMHSLLESVRHSRSFCQAGDWPVQGLLHVVLINVGVITAGFSTTPVTGGDR